MENPFFQRELRAAARRQFSLVAWPMVALVALLVFPLLLLEGFLAPEIDNLQVRKVLALIVFGLSYAGICTAVGWMIGSRVFLEEHRRNTLEMLRLVSTPPWKWVAQKLAYPLVGLGLVWSTAFPLQAALVIRGHLLPREIEPLTILAGCAGLTALGATLLMPPTGLRSLLRPDTRPTLPVLLHDLSYMAVPNWIALVLLTLGMNAVLSAVGYGTQVFRPRPFFQGWLRTDQGLAVLVGMFGLAALTAAYSTACPALPRVASASTFTRWLSIATAYYLMLGYTWSGVPGWGQMFAPAFLPLALAGAWVWGRRTARSRSARPEDQSAQREIGWLAKRLDNPVLIRDLRVALRGVGLTRRFIWLSVGLLLVCGLLGSLAAFPFVRLFGTAARGVTFLQLLYQSAGVASLLGFSAAVPCLLTIGSQAVVQWQAERRQQTFSQLFQSPISSHDLLLGRWIAALLVGTTRALPVVLLFLASYGLLSRGNGLPTILAIGAWLLSLGLVLSIGCAGAARRVTHIRDLLAPMPLAVGILLAEGLALSLVLAWLPDRLYVEMGELIRAYSLGMSGLNLGLTALLFFRVITELEKLRHQELE